MGDGSHIRAPDIPVVRVEVAICAAQTHDRADRQLVLRDDTVRNGWDRALCNCGIVLVSKNDGHVYMISKIYVTTYKIRHQTTYLLGS